MPTSEVKDEFCLLVAVTARDLYIQPQMDIPPDVREAARQAWEREDNPRTRAIYTTMDLAMRLADERDVLVCQDTGIPVYYVTMGTAPNVEGARLREAITNGVERATKEHPLCSSVVFPICDTLLSIAICACDALLTEWTYAQCSDVAELPRYAFKPTPISRTSAFPRAPRCLLLNSSGLAGYDPTYRDNSQVRQGA